MPDSIRKTTGLERVLELVAPVGDVRNDARLAHRARDAESRQLAAMAIALLEQLELVAVGKREREGCALVAHDDFGLAVSHAPEFTSWPAMPAIAKSQGSGRLAHGERAAG